MERGPRPRFDPAPHERELAAILSAVAAVAAADALDDRALDRLLKRHPKEGRGLFSRSELIAGARHLGPRLALDAASLVERLRLRPVRSASGVTPVTVLTKPFPCPGRCVFCPSDARMPKSYLSDEPGAQRAAANRFDPYLQTWNRLRACEETGHPVEKIELIVLGGTFSAYPERYRVWFVKRCLDALRDYGTGRDRRDAAGAAPSAFATLPGSARGDYDRVVARHLEAELGGARLHASEGASWEGLEAAQRANEGARCRCVGLSVETRPDRVSEEEVLRLRRLGATKVQLGIQHASDRVLAANRRGHDVAATRRAVHRLRAAGFKIQGHWMPNLLGATPEEDVADYARVFSDPGLCPDELKLYPCLLVESAELGESFRRGTWQPYADAELLDVVTACLAGTPAWCRLSRVIRDFSAHDVAAGTRVANLREVAERRLAADGVPVRDIRAREIRRAALDPGALVLSELRYATSLGQEVFLQWTAPGDRLAAFLRLSLPREPSFVAELRDSAVIREVHVYGAALELGRRGERAAQHRGLGRALVARAEALARAGGFPALSVISAVGTRPWYRSLGFADGALYQHRRLA